MDSNWPVFFHLVESNDSFIAKLSESELNRYTLDSGDTVQAAVYQAPISFHQSSPFSFASSHPPSPKALISSQDA